MAVIDQLKRQGYTQSEIARMFNRTRQAVSWHKYYYGGEMTPREEALRHWPWHVPAEQSQSAPYRAMRDHAEYMAVGPKCLTKSKRERLRALYRKLGTDKVLEFDPRIPPQPGINNKGGFAYRDREPGDGDLIIRVNEYTDLTEQGRMLWRFPPELP